MGLLYIFYIIYNNFDVSQVQVVMFPCCIRAEANEIEEHRVYKTSLADGSTQTYEIKACFAQKLRKLPW
jgi:hypothetical protein